MIKYSFSNRRPGPDSTTPVTLAGVSNYASTNQSVAFGKEVWREKFIYETLLCLALNVDEQPGQSACLQLLVGGAATNFVFLPQLAEAVIMQPVLQLVRIESTELCLPFHAVSNEDILWVKMIE